MSFALHTRSVLLGVNIASCCLTIEWKGTTLSKIGWNESSVLICNKEVSKPVASLWSNTQFDLESCFHLVVIYRICFYDAILVIYFKKG